MPHPQRILFLTLGTKGDLYPFLGLAVEMHRRGYQTTIISSENHREDCEAAGCEFVSIQSKTDYLNMVNHPHAFKPLFSLKIYFSMGIGPATEPAYRTIEKFASEGPCVLVFNNLMFAGVLAHEKLGLPVASLFLHPYSHMSFLDPAKETPLNATLLKLIGYHARKGVIRLFYRWYNRHLHAVQELRKKLNLSEHPDTMGSLRYAPPLIIDLWPEWFCPAKPDWQGSSVRTGFVDYDGPSKPLSQDLQEFLKKKPIVFTLGSGILGGYERSVQVFERVCRDLNRPGLFVGHQNQPHPHSELFRIVGPQPFREIFPSASLIVSHGGIGTVARAMAAGKPQIITPLANDQFDNGYHVERLGVGKCLPLKTISFEKLKSAVQQLQTLEVQSASQKIAEILRHSPGAAQTCDTIEEKLGLKNTGEFSKSRAV